MKQACASQRTIRVRQYAISKECAPHVRVDYKQHSIYILSNIMVNKIRWIPFMPPQAPILLLSSFFCVPQLLTTMNLIDILNLEIMFRPQTSRQSKFKSDHNYCRCGSYLNFDWHLYGNYIIILAYAKGTAKTKKDINIFAKRPEKVILNTTQRIKSPSLPAKARAKYIEQKNYYNARKVESDTCWFVGLSKRMWKENIKKKQLHTHRHRGIYNQRGFLYI